MNDRTAKSERPADLLSQLESLFDQVWVCERQWRVDDRFDLMLDVRRTGAER